MRTLAIAVLVLAFHSGFATSNSCGKFLFSNPDISPLENGIELIKDLIPSDPYPLILHQAARPITHVETQEIVNSFYRFALGAEKVANQLRDSEKEVLLQAVADYHKIIRSFVDNYHSLQLTSEILTHLFDLNNRMKGRAFEATIEIALMRLGFTKIHRGKNAHKALSQQFSTKIPKFDPDFIAMKNNLTYLFEVKSIKPEPHDQQERQLRATRYQILNRHIALRRAKIRDRVQLILISHYNLGAKTRADWMAAGPDAVVYFTTNGASENKVPSAKPEPTSPP